MGAMMTPRDSMLQNKAHVFRGSLSALILLTAACHDRGGSSTPVLSGDQQRMFSFPTVTTSAPIAAAGDVDGDGVGDIVVGDPDFDGSSGRAVVYSGANGTILRTLDNQAPGSNARLGAAVASAGDVDGDGRADIVVGAPGVAGAPGVKQAFVFSGETGAVIHVRQGLGNPWQFGDVVAGLSDHNGDGTNDFAVGESLPKVSASPDTSLMHVFSGVDGSLLRSVEAVPAAGVGSGATAIASIADLNGDGVAEVLAAIDGPASLVHSGADLRVLRTHAGAARAAANVGDVDGDSFADYALGFPGRRPGVVEVFSGRGGNIVRVVRGPASDDGFGSSVAGVGDVNGDGRADLLIGADKGFADLVSGADGSVIARQRLGGAASVHRVADLGDLNGDGVHEYAIVTDGRVQVLSGKDLALTIDNHLISLSLGGTEKMFVRAGVANQGRNYWILGSASGTSPGTTLGAIVLPLNFDSYLQHTLTYPNTHIIASSGVLDSTGGADASMTLPPGLSPSLRGTVLHHAFLVLTDAGVQSGSNAVPLVFVE